MFVVRIWREPREIENAAPQWRGLIEHVLSGARSYLGDIDGIAGFIAPYLAQMGVPLPSQGPLRRWLHCCRQLLKGAR